MHSVDSSKKAGIDIDNKLALVLVVLLGVNCCSCNWYENPPGKPATKEQLLSYLKKGFDETHHRVFFNWRPGEFYDRAHLLIEYLGYDWPYIGSPVTSIDGNWLRVEDRSYVEAYHKRIHFNNPKEVQYLIIGKHQPPQLVKVPLVSILDDHGQLIAWKEPGSNRHEWVLRSGKKLRLEEPTFGNSGTYFCDGGRYFDYEMEVMKESELYIYTVDEPNKPLVRCKLRVCDNLFTMQDRIYLVGYEVDKRPGDALCEVYLRQGNRLVFDREFRVRCPRLWVAQFIRPVDFDAVTRQIIFMLVHDAKFIGSPHYLYDIETAELIKIGKVRACFLDPDIFEKVLNVTDAKTSSSIDQNN